MSAEYEEIIYDGQPARSYEDGSIRNAHGQWLVQHPAGHTITQADASTLALRRVELARERVVKGANAAVAKAKPNDWENPQDLDYVEAIAEAQATQALLIGDPTSTRAAEWTMAHSGLAEAKQQEARVVRHEYTMDAQTAEVVAGMLRQIEARQAELNLIDVKLTNPGEEGTE